MASILRLKRPTSYRHRHLTPYDSVCFGTPVPTTGIIPAPVPLPTSPPTTAIIPAPVPSPKYPTPYSGGKGGKGNGPASGPTNKNVPCPPSGRKSGGSTSKSPPGPSPNKSGPSPSRSGPSPSRNGPSPSKSGPNPSRSSGGSSSKSGPAPGCSRFLKFAAATLGFSMTKDPAVVEIQDTLPLVTPFSAAITATSERSLGQTITLNTTFLAFGSYPLSSSFSGFALLTWPNFCFSAIVEVSNFIPNCQGCSFVVTDGSHSCVPSTIPQVVPFIDPTEIPFNPYTNSTFFNTDANGNAMVTINNLCTGTGPVDNYQRPLLLLDPTGQIAACGRLTYQCQ